MSTGRFALRPRRRFNTSKPESFGRPRSRIRRSNWPVVSAASAAVPSFTQSTEYPDCRRLRVRPSARTASSSAMRIRTAPLLLSQASALERRFRETSLALALRPGPSRRGNHERKGPASLRGLAVDSWKFGLHVHVHAAHAAHPAVRVAAAGVLLLLDQLGDADVGREEQTRHRRGVL